MQRRLQPVVVSEPTVDEIIEILEGLRDKYEEFHGIKYEYEVVSTRNLVWEVVKKNGLLL